jgi:hypothetical protein
MTSPKSICTKFEFTLGDDAAENYRFRQAVSQLLEEFGQSLVGFQAEDLHANDFFCVDAQKEEAEAVLKTLFPRPMSAESGNAKQS